MTRSAPIFGRLVGVGIFVCLVWLAGCSPGGLPTAPNPADEGMQAASPGAIQQAVPAGIAISPLSLSKPAGPQKRLVKEKLIWARTGGLISILAEDNQTFVCFAVPPGALEADTRIRMEVIGAGPSVVVRFGPSPLSFQKPCALTISLPEDGVDPEGLGGYLITEKGAEPVPYTVEVIGNRIVVTISVSHFSLYSSGDDDPYANDVGGDPDP